MNNTKKPLKYRVKDENCAAWGLPVGHNPISLSEIYAYATLRGMPFLPLLQQADCVNDPLPAYMTDAALTPQAVMIMTYLIALPTTQNLMLRKVQQALGYEKEATIVAFKQLENMGYVVRKRKRSYGKQGNAKVKEEYLRYLLYPNKDGIEYEK